MTPQEKDAIVNYVGFNLIKMVEQFEDRVSLEVLYDMYEQVYATMGDFERTMNTNIELSKKASLKDSDD